MAREGRVEREAGRCYSPGMRALDLMTTDVITLEHTATVADAITMVTEHEVRHIPIVQDGILVGVVSDRELRRVDGLVALDVDHPDAATNVLGSPILSLVNGPPIACRPSAHVDELIDLIVRERVGAVLITDEPGHVLGIVSTLDILCAARGRFG